MQRQFGEGFGGFAPGLDGEHDAFHGAKENFFGGFFGRGWRDDGWRLFGERDIKTSADRNSHHNRDSRDAQVELSAEQAAAITLCTLCHRGQL